MSEDDKKENPKTVYRFDNEDWIVPLSRDQIKKRKLINLKKNQTKSLIPRISYYRNELLLKIDVLQNIIVVS